MSVGRLQEEWGALKEMRKRQQKLRKAEASCRDAASAARRHPVLSASRPGRDPNSHTAALQPEPRKNKQVDMHQRDHIEVPRTKSKTKRDAGSPNLCHTTPRQRGTHAEPPAALRGSPLRPRQAEIASYEYKRIRSVLYLQLPSCFMHMIAITTIMVIGCWILEPPPQQKLSGPRPSSESASAAGKPSNPSKARPCSNPAGTVACAKQFVSKHCAALE